MRVLRCHLWQVQASDNTVSVCIDVFTPITAPLVACYAPPLHCTLPDDQELEGLHYESWYKDVDMDFTQVRVCYKTSLALHDLCTIVLGEVCSMVCVGHYLCIVL